MECTTRREREEEPFRGSVKRRKRRGWIAGGGRKM